MSYNDWDPEDLLNFEYDKPRPKEIISPEEQMRKDAQEAAYLKYRQEYAEKQPPQPMEERGRAARRAAKEASKAETKREAKAAAKAAKKAGKKAKGKPVAVNATKAVAKASKLYKFSKFLSIPYVALFAAFTIAMTIMNVLPFWMMVALYIVLGLLSLIIVIQLTKDNVKKWAKVFSTIMACILIVFYGVGTAYALGTLSFLDTTSVKNENSVDKITKEPFNVLITGMDVWGRINKQGRSDVNMVVTVNPNTETILMTSIPRDYEVRLPDMNYATDKLTHSGFYGVENTIHAIEDLLQITTNYYVRVNFTTIIKFIDAIGGLDFYNPVEFTSAIADYHYDEGNIHVDGRAALYYARERKAFMGGDNDRVKNQQLIFSEMLKKATSSSTMLFSYSKILSNLDKRFEMSFSSKELRSLVKMQFARRIKWKMYKNTLEGGGATKPTYSTGSQAVYVTEPYQESVTNAQELIQAVMNGKKLAKDKETDQVYVKEETQEAAE